MPLTFDLAILPLGIHLKKKKSTCLPYVQIVYCGIVFSNKLGTKQTSINRGLIK